MTDETRATKRDHWKSVLDRWRESGLSKAAFCRENGIRPWQFHYWCRRLAEPEPLNDGFARVQCAEFGGTGVRVRLPSGLTLELAPDFDPEVLVRFLRAAASC